MITKLKGDVIMECTENAEKNKEGIIKSIKHKIPLMIAEVVWHQEELNHQKFTDIFFEKEKITNMEELFKQRAEEAKVFFDLA